MSRYKQPYCLFKRGKYWHYRTYDNQGNRTVAKTTGLTSKTAAISYLNGLYKDNRLYQHEITFGQFAKHFLDDGSPYLMDRTQKLSSRTLHGYRNALNNHLLPALYDTKLTDITYSTLKTVRMSFLRKGLSVSTIIGMMTLLKTIILTAYKDDLIQRNPFDGLEQLDLQQNNRDAYTLEEVKNLVSKMPEEYKNFVRLMALTGLRISEANGVRLDDIMEENGILYINLTKQLIKNDYEPLKNGQGRKIPIIKEIVNLIYSEKISTSRFYRKFVPAERTCENAENRNLTVHSLRHFFITNAKSKGVMPLKVETIAGHKLKGIENIYTNFNVVDLSDILSWQKETLTLIT